MTLFPDAQINLCLRSVCSIVYRRLIGYLYHRMSYHLVAAFISFLENLDYFTFAEIVVLNMHNGIVKRLMTLSGSVPTVTPAIFLVDRKGEKAQLIASGALSLEDLKDRLVQVSGLARSTNSTLQTLPRL